MAGIVNVGAAWFALEAVRTKGCFVYFAALIAALLVLPPQASPTGSRLHEIREWIEAYEAAFRGGSLEGVSKFYAESATVVEGNETTTWSEIKDHRLPAVFRDVQNINFRVLDTRVHIVDDAATLAYVTSTVEFHVRKVGHELHKRTAETLLLERKGEMGWRIRHVHRSEPWDR